MSIHGDYSVNISDLKKWVNDFNIKDMYPHHLRDEDTDLVVEAQFLSFKKVILSLDNSEDWRICCRLLSPVAIKSLFQVAENAIRIANYYECFIVPADIETKKKLIKGFDYSSIGAVQINNGDIHVACIGEKSDLIWSVFYDYFIHETDAGNIEHAYGRHEEIMSIQLPNVAGLALVEIEQIVKEVLLKCSIELDLHFKIEYIDKKMSDLGIDNIYKLNVSNSEYESEPAMYFSNAIGSTDTRVRYLSYYQVLEYFFIRSQNINFLEKLDAGKIRDAGKIKHRELRLILKQYNNTLKESESLKLVLSRSLDIENLKRWIRSTPERETLLCSQNGTIPTLDLSAIDEKIISKLAARIYYYRCAIAHAKGDIDEYIALPYQNDKTINSELPLIRYVASLVLKECSEI